MPTPLLFHSRECHTSPAWGEFDLAHVPQAWAWHCEHAARPSGRWGPKTQEERETMFAANQMQAR